MSAPVAVPLTIAVLTVWNCASSELIVATELTMFWSAVSRTLDTVALAELRPLARFCAAPSTAAAAAELPGDEEKVWSAVFRDCSSVAGDCAAAVALPVVVASLTVCCSWVKPLDSA